MQSSSKLPVNYYDLINQNQSPKPERISFIKVEFIAVVVLDFSLPSVLSMSPKPQIMPVYFYLHVCVFHVSQWKRKLL